MPASLAVIGFVLGWATTEPSDPHAWPDADVPVPEVVLAWAATTPSGLLLTRRA